MASFSMSSPIWEDWYQNSRPYTEAAEDDRWSQIKWMRSAYPSSRTMQDLFSFPSMEGQQIPFQNMMQSQLYPEGMATTFSGENTGLGTRQLQDFYKNRSYGLSDQLAQSLAAQSMEPLRLGNMDFGTPRATRDTVKPDISAMVGGALGKQLPSNIDPIDRLASAAELSQYNAWRGSMLPKTIG